MKRKNFILLLVVLMLRATLATPTISGLKVSTISPLGLAIDYTVDGATGDDVERAIEVTMAVNGVTNVAKSVSGETNCVNGAHRVYWNTAKDGILVEKGGAVISVRYKPPLYCVIDLSGGTSAASFAVSYRDTPPEGGFNTDEYKTTKLVLRCISAGTFVMGGRETDYPGAVNTNLHMVTLTRDFYAGVFEITQRQWELVMGNRPSEFANEVCYMTRPVERVSYQDVRGTNKGMSWPQTSDVDGDSFMGTLRRKTGLEALDLPTEAQWEYACRAGTTTALNDGRNLSGMTNAIELASFARYAYNSGWAVDVYLRVKDGYVWSDFSCGTEKGPHKVGSYKANAYSLYDMHGNIYEMCLDVYGPMQGSTDPCGNDVGYIDPELGRAARVVRGGSWRHPAYCCRSAFREHFWVNGRGINVGLRLFMTVE